MLDGLSYLPMWAVMMIYIMILDPLTILSSLSPRGRHDYSLHQLVCFYFDTGMRAINFIHPHILLVHVVMPVLFDLIADWPALDRGIICRRSGMHPELTGCVPAPGPSIP
jgi:hypothetical protein